MVVALALKSKQCKAKIRISQIEGRTMQGCECRACFLDRLSEMINCRSIRREHLFFKLQYMPVTTGADDISDLLAEDSCKGLLSFLELYIQPEAMVNFLTSFSSHT